MDMMKEKCGEPSHEEAVMRTKSEPTHKQKPYQKPAFQFERVFETMALSCGKTNTTQRQCHFNRKNS